MDSDARYRPLRRAEKTRLHNKDRAPALGARTTNDILVSFDDERAGPAFEPQSHLPASSKVLLFTDHKHLPSIAEGTVAKTALTVYRLKYIERKCYLITSVQMFHRLEHFESRDSFEQEV